MKINFVSNVLNYIIILVSLTGVSSCKNSNSQLTLVTHENDYESGINKAKEALKCSPFQECSVWDPKILNQDYLLKNIIKESLSKNYAMKAFELNLNNKTRDEIKNILLRDGFKIETASSLNNTDSGIIFVHPDGSGVRIKDYDPNRKFRQQSYYVKFAMRDSKKPASWENEAFKISREGIIIPKAPQAMYGIKTSAPYSLGAQEDAGWLDHIMNAVHINFSN